MELDRFINRRIAIGSKIEFGKLRSRAILRFANSETNLNWLSCLLQGKYLILKYRGLLPYLAFGVGGTYAYRESSALVNPELRFINYVEWAWFKTEEIRQLLFNSLAELGLEYSFNDNRFIYGVSLTCYYTTASSGAWSRFQEGLNFKIGYKF